MTITILNRKDVRDEVYLGLLTACAGSGKPASNVYKGQKKELQKESPVLLILSSGIQREISGVGTQVYENKFNLELMYMVYNGSENNPLDEDEREDALDDLEAAAAAWCAAHQTGTKYRSLVYTPQMTEVIPIKYIDGNPYLIETVLLTIEGRDA